MKQVSMVTLARLSLMSSCFGSQLATAAAPGPCPGPIFIQAFDTSAATVCQRTKARFDYFGSYATSFGVLAPGPNNSILWNLSSNGSPAAPISVQLGLQSSNGISEADFDGDGKFDIAVYDINVGGFTYLPSSGSTVVTVPWGNPATDFYGAVGDYDCDGKSDPTYVRNVGGAIQWAIKTSGPGADRTITFGTWGTDNALPGMDWNGDGCDDLGTVQFGASNDITYRIGNASNGALLLSQAWGNSSTDFIVPGDYLGDERADFAVWRSFGVGTSGEWLIKENGGGGTLTQVFGTPGALAARDMALRGDFDGDGKDDIAVKKNGTAIWQWRRSSDGATDQRTVGTPGNFPIPATGVQ